VRHIDEKENEDCKVLEMTWLTPHKRGEEKREKLIVKDEEMKRDRQRINFDS